MRKRLSKGINGINQCPSGQTHNRINNLLGGTSIIDISVNNGQNGPIFHKETNRHTRDK